MKHLTLFELNASLADVIDDIIDADMDGELTEDDPLYAELDALYEARAEKHEAYVHVIKNAYTAAEACKAEANLFLKRARALTNLAKRLKETLRADLEQHGENATTAGCFQIKRQNGHPRVIVHVDPSELPTAYQRLIVEVDKTALRDALKSGDTIEGAELESTEHVRIRVK